VLKFKDYKNIETRSDVRCFLRYQIKQASGRQSFSSVTPNLKNRNRYANDEAIDAVLCGQNEGYLDIIKLKTLSIVAS